MTSKQSKDLAKIVGAANVITDPAVLGGYASASGFVSGKAPVCVVRVTDTLQVEEIVKLANKEDFKLLPVSSADEHLHGGSVPACDNTVIVDLSGLKAIYDADRTFRMAVFEAGVTYGELQPYLKEKGLMADMPLAPKADKSVVASLIETEPRLNPNMQWNILDPLRSTEVIWGDGNRMRTGEAAAAPLSKNGPEMVKFMHDEKHKFLIGSNGPDTIDYYRLICGAQGTMGIVTWVTMKCALLPDICEAFFAPSDDIAKCVEFMYNMEHLRCGDGLFLLDRFDFAALMSSTKEEADAMMDKLPKWIVLAVLASRPPLPELRIKGQKECMEDAAAKAGVKLVRELAGLSATKVMDRAFTPCEKGKYWQDMYAGSFASIIFSTTMDKVEKFVDIMRKAAVDEAIDPAKIGAYVQPRHQGVECRVEFSIPYDEQSKAKAEKLFDKASRLLLDAGAYYAKPYGRWAKMQLKPGSGSLDRLKRLKNIFDPKNVLAPGRLSNWDALE